MFGHPLASDWAARVAEVDLAQLVHELRLHLRAAAGQQLGVYPQPGRGDAVPDSPGAQLGEHRDGLDRGFGEAVGGPPSGARVVAGEQPGTGEPLEAVGQDVGGDLMVRVPVVKCNRITG